MKAPISSDSLEWLSSTCLKVLKEDKKERVIIAIRGRPGCGKSYLGKRDFPAPPAARKYFTYILFGDKNIRGKLS